MTARLIVKSLFAASMALPVLTGCATSSGSAGQQERASSAQAAGRLPAQDLAVGECGLFVFTADKFKRFILFSKGDDGTALWANDGKEVKLTRTFAGGLSAYGQYPQAEFSGPDGLTLSLRLSGGQDIETGMRFPEGRLKARRADGWEMIMPVVALASCQRP